MQILQPDKIAQKPAQTRVLPPTSPVGIAKEHEEEIKALAQRAMIAFKQKEFEKCSNKEKAEAILQAMKDPELFKFQYKKQDGTKIPKTAEETYAERRGNCVGLVSNYVSIAEIAGITGLTQIYAIFEDKETEKAADHIALLLKDEETKTVTYVDPSLGVFRQLSGKTMEPEQVANDQKFREYLDGLRSSIIADDSNRYALRALGVVRKREDFDAAYYFNMGVYSATMKDTKGVIDNFSKAAEKGIATRFVYSQIAQAHYENKDYGQAIEFYGKALEKRKNVADYRDLARTYFDKTDYDGAIETLQKLMRFDPKNTDTKIDLGGAHIEKGLVEFDKEAYPEAKVQFLLSRDSLFSALRKIKRTKNPEIPQLLHDNLEAYFVNQYRTLRALNERTGVAILQKDYEKIKKLGFESETVERLF